MLVEFVSFVNVHHVGLLSVTIGVKSTRLTDCKHTTVTVCGRSPPCPPVHHGEESPEAEDAENINERHTNRTTETFKRLKCFRL